MDGKDRQKRGRSGNLDIAAHLPTFLPIGHSHRNVARKLGLLDRVQNDARAVTALDESLREMDPVDPVKYDFALFGLGIFEGF